MHITLKNAELLKHSKLDKTRFYLIYNVLITLRFLTLCASVGNKKGSRNTYVYTLELVI